MQPQKRRRFRLLSLFITLLRVSNMFIFFFFFFGYTCYSIPALHSKSQHYSDVVGHQSHGFSLTCLLMSLLHLVTGQSIAFSSLSDLSDSWACCVFLRIEQALTTQRNSLECLMSNCLWHGGGESVCQCRRCRFNQSLGQGRSPEGGNPLPYYGLGASMSREPGKL